ncbi:MAG: hypothetical protein KGZ32_03635 [Dethiobacter sp.]|jgi:hypothetical protein|nr:hypothetical protein [Dethiobacter sp.]
MIEVKGNTLIIKVDKKEDTYIFDEIIDLVRAKLKKQTMDKLIQLSEEYRMSAPDFRFNREEIYGDESRFHRQ